MKAISSSLKSAANLTMQTLENRLDNLLESVAASERMDADNLKSRVAELETKLMEQKVCIGAIVHEQQLVIDDLKSAIVANGDKDLVDTCSRIWSGDKPDTGGASTEDGVQELLKEAGRRVAVAEIEAQKAQTALEVANKNHLRTAEQLQQHIDELTDALATAKLNEKAIDQVTLEYSKVSSTLEEKQQLIEMLREQLDARTSNEEAPRNASDNYNMLPIENSAAPTKDSSTMGLLADLRRELSQSTLDDGTATNSEQSATVSIEQESLDPTVRNLQQLVEKQRQELESLKAQHSKDIEQRLHQQAEEFRIGFEEELKAFQVVHLDEVRQEMQIEQERAILQVRQENSAAQGKLRSEMETRTQCEVNEQVVNAETKLNEEFQVQLTNELLKLREELGEAHKSEIESIKAKHATELSNAKETTRKSVLTQLTKEFELRHQEAANKFSAELENTKRKVAEDFQLELDQSIDQLKSELESAHQTYVLELQEKHENDVTEAAEQAKSDAMENIDSMIAAARNEAMVEFATNLQTELDTLKDSMTRDHETATAELSTRHQDQLAQLRQTLEHEAATREANLRASLAVAHEEELAEKLWKQQSELKQEMENKIQHLTETYEEQANVLRQQYLEESKLRRRVHNELVDLRGNIRVFVRVRPVLEVEEEKGAGVAVSVYRDGEVSVDKLDGSGSVRFEFDEAFGPQSTQKDVFNTTEPLVHSVLDGFNVCLFAYGQTGSGKTYTMEGPAHDRGVNFQALEQLFSLQQDRKENFETTFMLSVLEIYNEAIYDLLVERSDPLDIKLNSSGQVHVRGLTQRPVMDMSHVENAIDQAQLNRSVGAHSMNEHSSRSHLVLTVVATTTNLVDGEQTQGRLNLIDLAGSERISKTDATGDRLKEAQCINKSLSALGDVIQALGERRKGSHVPFRNSKLTHLLQPSLGGNSKVAMFVNTSPAEYNVLESLCSLKFAARCRKVTLGAAKKNTVSGGSSNSEVSKLKRQVAELQQQLELQNGSRRSRTGSLLGNATNMQN